MMAPGMLMRERAPPAAFAALAAPLEVGGHLLRNRFVQGPMCAMYAAPDGSATRQTVEYYRARAAGGAALIIVEITFTDDGGSRAFHAQLGAHSDTMIPGLSDLAEAIAAHGALPGLQLGHCGPQRVISAGPLVAPSAIPWAPGKRVPAALTTAGRGQHDTVGGDGTGGGLAVGLGDDLVAHGTFLRAAG